jgi:myo-inositol-1(or 4)-monophosphatase
MCSNSGVREERDALRRVAERVAGEAAELAANMRAEAITSVRTKSTGTDVVTAADTAVEALLRRRLAEVRPGEPVLGEEGGADRPAGPGELYWVVDPIDGTVNYLYGMPWYAVSVAAGRDGVIQAGAVVEPASGRVWSAALDAGATLDGRTLRVAGEARPLELALIGTGFSYDRARRVRQGRLAAELLGVVRDVRRAGSAALDLCAVGAGWLDGYYEHAINAWDWAAGALIATEAGARVLPPDPAAPYGPAIVAAAPGVSEALCAALTRLGGSGID